MGYSEKLEQSMKNFDREVDKLSKINDLVKEIDGLTELFLEESKDFQGSVKRLSELKAGIEKDCAVLSKFAGAEAAARQKLLADIHNTVAKDAQKIIADLSEPLASVKSALTDTVQKLDAFATTHNKSQEKFLSDEKNLLDTFTANETVARQKLLADIHNTVAKDAQKIIADLSEPLTSVKSALTDTAQKLDAFATAHKKSQEKFLADEKNLLDTFAANETVARQKLLEDVHEKIITDSRQIINEIAEPLNATNAELQKNCKEIGDFIALHKKSQEKFLSDTEDLLIKYNTKNLETYNNLLASLSNKIDLAKSALEKLLANQDNLLADLSRKTDQNNLDLENSLTAKLEEQNKKLSAEVETLKEKISALSYIKTATTAAVGFGILSCIINFIK